MAEANESRIGSSREMSATHLSLFPRDLLQRFMPSTADAQNPAFRGDDEDEGGGIELNLGLSLGGRFGIDKTSSKKLTRSSSIVGTVPFLREEKSTAEAAPSNAAAAAPHTTGLMRTTSLPTETEEWRKRKEMQTLRRMEAKRRRSEKQRNNNKTEPNLEEASARRSVADTVAETSKDVFLRKQQGNSRHGSAESRGGGGGGGSSSSMSELETRTVPASSNCSEARRLRRLSSVDINEDKDKTGMGEMPCVFTKGQGPNGRRVDGILYKYGKGEEVRIMCVCHGTFLSPAEFVKHAGGADADHPLRHIVVNTSAASFL